MIVVFSGNTHLFVKHRYIDNTSQVSFDIKFTWQGFDSSCIPKAGPGKLDIKRLLPAICFQVFYDYIVISYLRVDSTSLTTSFIKCNVLRTQYSYIQ